MQRGNILRGFDLLLHDQGADGFNSAVRTAVLSTCSGSVDVADGAAAVPIGLAAYLCTVPNAVLRNNPTLAFQTGKKSGMAAFHGNPRKRVLVFLRTRRTSRLSRITLRTGG